MKLLYKILLSWAFVLIISPLFSQVMVSAVGQPNALIICEGDSTFSLLVANTTGGTMEDAQLQLDLPASCQYMPGSIVGATEVDISNLNQPMFQLPSIPNNTAHNIDFNAEIICGYNNTENFNYIVTHNGNTYTGNDSPLQNYYFASIVITNINNGTVSVPVGQTITRDFTIEQQGLNASVDTIIILDEHGPDIQVQSVSVGTLIIDGGPGPVYVDTIILTGSDLPGGNGLFDYGETIILSETVKLEGCNNGESTIDVNWGCYDDVCDNFTAFPSVNAASGNPILQFAFTNNNQGWGFTDNSGYVEYTITNNGVGEGTAFDLVTLAGFSSSGSAYYPNGNWINEVDSFSVNGHYVVADFNYGSTSAQGRWSYYFSFPYTSDPDGAGVGVEDIDGDGFYDDLPVGNTVTIKAHTYYDWNEAVNGIATGSQCGRGWTNNAWQHFRRGADYIDQCGDQAGPQWPGGSVSLFQTYNTNTLDHNMPPDVYEGEIVWMEQQVVTTTRVDDDGCPNDSVIYQVIVPNGLELAPPNATFKGNNMGTPQINGNVITYFLDKNQVKSGGWFSVPFQLDCNGPHPATGTIQARLRFWCDGTNFPARYFTYWCSETPIFGLQCPPGNCTDPYISHFSVERTNFGWLDSQLNQKANALSPGINLDYAMARDSIKIEVGGILNGPVDSLRIKVQHNSVPGNWGNNLFFDYLTDTLFFLDFETGDWDTCVNLNPQLINGTVSSLDLDISSLKAPGGCLEGVNFTDGDSLFYKVNASVRNIQRNYWEDVPAFRARIYAKVDNSEEYCNDRGVSFNILGSSSPYVSNTNTTASIVDGCDIIQIYGQIYRWMDDCGGEVPFPNEVRPYVVLDSMTFSIPPGFEYQTGSAEHRYRNINGGLITEGIADPIIQVNATEQLLIFVRDASWSYSAYRDCSWDQDRIDFKIIPSCEATSSIAISMNSQGRYQFYADGIGITQNRNTSGSRNYTRANIQLTPLITTASGIQDTTSWLLRLCNTTDLDAENNWLAFESLSAGIEITELIDITDPNSQTSIPVTNYGNGKYWGQMGTLTADSCYTYLVKGVYNSCSYDSLFVRHAHNCVGYPVNPELGYPPIAYGCNENTTMLYLDSKDINFNISVVSPVNPLNLCDTLEYDVEVNNTQLSYAYDLKLSIEVPPGVGILSGTSYFKFPSTSGTYIPIGDPVNEPAGSNKWVYDISQDPNGTVLLKGSDSIPLNSYRLKYKVITDCDLISGTAMKVTALGSNACGAGHSRSSFSSPILIDGLPTNVNLYVLSTEADPYLPTCSNASTVKVKIINLGPNSVSSIEMLSSNIDDAYDYVPGSIVNIHNGPNGVSQNQVIGGIRYLRFAITPNLAVNDSIVFTYDLIDVDPGTLECDTIVLETNAMLVAAVNCPTAPGGSCLIQSITSSLDTYLEVRKDNAVFGSYQASSIPSADTAELFAVDYSVLNSGYQNFQSDSLYVLFVYDANGNGIPDDTGNDSLYLERISVENLAPGDSVTSSVSFLVNAAKTCGILVAIRLSEDSCICSETVLEISDIHLYNGGADTSVCTQNDLQIGMDSTQGYSYVWSPSLYLDIPTLPNPVFNYSGTLTTPDTLLYILNTTRSGGCVSNDSVSIIVFPHAQAYPGSDERICAGTDFHFANCDSLPWAIFYDSIQWIGGNGSFLYSDSIYPVYQHGPNELGPVELSIIAFSHQNCSQDTVTMTLLIDTLPQPSFSYAPNNQICVDEGIQFNGMNQNQTQVISWFWDLGDGTNAFTQTVDHSYQNSGNYPVSLTLINNYGCVNTFTDTVRIHELPVASIDIVPNESICAFELFSFHGSSTTNIIDWQWDFGDGYTANGQNVDHAFSQNGDYLVSLIVSNDNSCNDTVYDSVYVYPLPVVDFSSFPSDTSCIYGMVEFHGNTLENIISWDWDFGDGTIANGQNVSHTYMQTGNYIINLYVENENACRDTVTDTLFVRGQPFADYTISPRDTNCVNEDVHFNGFSNDQIILWEWEFGDGNTDTGQQVTHQYANAGNHTILLIYTDIFGCTDTVYHDRVIGNPIINFTMNPNPVCQNFEVSFASTGDKIAYDTYNWDFGDGIGSATGYNVNYTYASSGTFDVTLSVCSKTVTKQIVVNPTCITDAGSDEATCEDVPFDLSGSAIPPTAEGYASIQWSGGQGSFNDPGLVAPVYTPGATELGSVTLTMIAYGIPPCANDTSSMVLQVIEGAYAFAGSDENVCIGESYDLANASTPPFATNYDTLYWFGGTGWFDNPYVEQPVYHPGPGEIGPVQLTMVASGFLVNCDSIDDMILHIRPETLTQLYPVICYGDSLYAQDEWRYSSGIFYDTLQSIYGCDSVIETNLTVYPEIDKNFYLSTGDSICLGEEAIFYQTGTATLVNWLWDFGDGNISYNTNPAHTFADTGNYRVWFYYYDNLGCNDSVFRDISVFPIPEVDILSQIDYACVGTPLSFQGISNHTVVEWNWDFGDGQTGIGQFIDHTYNQAGEYLVTLTILDINGCSESTSAYYIAVPDPVINFEWDIILCDSLSFTDYSTPPDNYYLVMWHWDFGDGDTSNIPDPDHQFPGGGIYNVSLTVTADSSGYLCSSTLEMQVQVPENPTIYYSWMPEPACLGDTTFFFGATGNYITDYFWDFDDGHHDSILSPSHVYAFPGSFDVLFHITDTNGCVNSLSNVVHVNDIPNVTMGISSNEVCGNESIQFTATTSSVIDQWYWTFGDGSFATVQNPSHIYNAPGWYFVNLHVTDTAGCTNSVLDSVFVKPEPSANFGHNQASCQAVAFYDQSTAPAGYNLVAWDWDFGDGIGSASSQNPTYAYQVGGTYNVELIVTSDSSGYYCTDTIIQSVQVESAPNGFFTWFPEPGCKGDSVYFFATSGSPIVSWQWDFGDGYQGNGQNIAHLFSSAGSFDVQLYLTDTSGCATTVTHTITINELPSVDIDISTDESCGSEPIQFTGISPDNILFWLWDFGDGGLSIQQNPVHVYTSSGLFTVSLTVVDFNGCTNTTYESIRILPQPDAAFSYLVQQCQTIAFTDQSIAPPGYTNVAWEWDFGDATTSNAQNPLHAFTAGGTYNVQLIVQSDSSGYSCFDTIMNPVIVPNGPSVFFTWDPDPAVVGSAVTFSGTSGNTVTSWYWSFGDGNTAFGQNPDHTYDTPGIYAVTLIITDDIGCEAAISQDVTVVDIPDITMTIDPMPACIDETVSFFGQSSGNITNWTWLFGDGSMSSDQNPIHIYDTPGTYTVRLSIKDIYGATNMKELELDVLDLPVASFNTDIGACANNEILFDDVSATANGYIVNWEWNFDDGTVISVDFPDNPDMYHSYNSAGTYHPMLTVTTSYGCEDTVSMELLVVEGPMADFNWDDACQNQPLEFTDNSVSAGPFNIIGWYWDFGDPLSGQNNTSTLTNPFHLFSQPGTYNVMLVVTNEINCQDTSFQEVTVEPSPAIDFYWISSCQDQPVQFMINDSITNVSSINSWDWDFGDGLTSNQQNPEHIYDTSGTYTVTLIVTDNNGCINQVNHDIAVVPLPSVFFSYEDGSCSNTEVQFTDNSSTLSGIIEEWIWDYGDGEMDTVYFPNSPNVSHLYISSGTYTVTLTVTTSDSCVNTAMNEIVVLDSPIAEFSQEGDCIEEPFVFTDLSTVVGGYEISEWHWDFGDPASGGNNYSTQQNPNHTYNQPGYYYVELEITNSVGCTDRDTNEVFVAPPPPVEFIYSENVCFGEESQFIVDTSVVNTALIEEFLWDFGDGSAFVTLQDPTYTYPNPGSYWVTLTITDTSGCTNSISHIVDVVEPPIALFTYSGGCIGDTTLFTDQSFTITGHPIVEWYWDFDDPAATNDTSNLQHPTYAFPALGTYNVMLRITNSIGCQDTVFYVVNILEGPVSEFSYITNTCDEGLVYFYDESYDSTTVILDWQWRFGDEYNANEQNPIYTFEHSDTNYLVSLEVTDLRGCKNIVFDSVYIPEELDVVIDNSLTCFGDSTSFSATLTTPVNDSIILYFWDFGEPESGAFNYSMLANPTHKYSSPGMYTVKLEVQDATGCNKEFYKTVLVKYLPEADFTYQSLICDSLVTFTDASYSYDGIINNWQWDFGDGSPPVIINGLDSGDTSHVYLIPGYYNTMLVIQNMNGCSDTINKEIYVESCILADFGIQSDLPCEGTEVFFEDLCNSFSSIENWYWDFGDGSDTSYSTYSPGITHRYEEAGIYQVKLKVSTYSNQVYYSDSIIHSHEILVGPNANFTVSEVCLGDPSLFTNLSSHNGIPIITWRWNFGEAGSLISEEEDPQYIYSIADTFYVELHVINEYGCTDSILIPAIVNPTPLADFNYNYACIEIPTHFSDSSIVDGTIIDSWFWDFGVEASSFDTSSLQNPTYVYTDTTQHYVWLRVMTDKSCIDTIGKTIQVNRTPYSLFSYLENFENVQGQLRLVNQSTGANSYEWYMGDGSYTTEDNPVHAFVEDGTYIIELVSWNEQNCPDTSKVEYDLLFKGLYVPNAFSPDNEVEDVQLFKPVGTNLLEYHVQIVSRWGDLIWESSAIDDYGSPLEGWDGTWQGKPMPSDVYMWKISATFKDGTVWEGSSIGNNPNEYPKNIGTVTLIR